MNLHADNCAGQNKNKYVIFFLLYLALTKRYKTVSLYFMIPGHTKNICDSSFGNVKRLYRKRNVLHPGDMMSVIEESSKTSRCIPSRNVKWQDWRSLLEKQFKVPSNFKITAFQSFTSKMHAPGKLFVKKLHNSEDELCFDFLRNNSGETAAASILQALEDDS